MSIRRIIREHPIAIIVLAAAVLSLPVIVPLGVRGYNASFRTVLAVPFDSLRWKHEPWGERVRLRMVDDLVASRLLMGRSRVEVFGILGEPFRKGPYDCYFGWVDETSRWHDAITGGGRVLRCALGRLGGRELSLDVEFDSTDRVIATTLRER
jgi:hypothetical protein